MIKAPVRFQDIARWTMLGSLVVIATLNQFNFTVKPFLAIARDIPVMTLKNDAEKLQLLAPDLFSLVQAVNAFPPTTRFYFVPCFDDSGNTGRWWWYVYLMARYMGYPRLVFCHDKVLYNNDKTTFLSRYIDKARTWQDLDWITSRNIQVIILMRRNRVEFLEPASPIGGL